ncbi:deoxyribonuclease TATDN2 [Aphelenchoides avenae]|nr:deoxyribonuclease TATDN2 [Aphelenchus avenae]
MVYDPLNNILSSPSTPATSNPRDVVERLTNDVVTQNAKIRNAKSDTLERLKAFLGMKEWTDRVESEFLPIAESKIGTEDELKTAISMYLVGTMLRFEKAPLKEPPSGRDERRTCTVPMEVDKVATSSPVTMLKKIRQREDVPVFARQTSEPLGASTRQQPSTSTHRNGGGPPQNKHISLARNEARVDGVETRGAPSERPVHVTSQRVEPIRATQVDVRADRGVSSSREAGKLRRQPSHSSTSDRAPHRRDRTPRTEEESRRNTEARPAPAHVSSQRVEPIRAPMESDSGPPGVTTFVVRGLKAYEKSQASIDRAEGSEVRPLQTPRRCEPNGSGNHFDTNNNGSAARDVVGPVRQAEERRQGYEVEQSGSVVRTISAAQVDRAEVRPLKQSRQREPTEVDRDEQRSMLYRTRHGPESTKWSEKWRRNDADTAPAHVKSTAVRPLTGPREVPSTSSSHSSAESDRGTKRRYANDYAQSFSSSGDSSLSARNVGCSQVDEPIHSAARRRTRFDERPKSYRGRPPLFDSHVHLDRMSQMGIDFEWFERLRASRSHEFLGCVVNFCDPPNFDETSEAYNIREILAEVPTEMRPLVSITIGCHPQNADIFFTVEAYMKRLFDSRRPSLDEWPVVAVGECGLDSEWLYQSSLAQQEYAFRAQIRFAIDSGLPIILHIRDNIGEVTMDRRALQILREENLPRDHPIHRHCYDKGFADARIWMAEFSNIAFGVTNLLLSRNVLDLQELVGWLSGRGMLLLETDSPYFKKENGVPSNTPESIAVIARKVAELQGRHPDDVMRECTQTAKNLYRIK